MPAKRRIPPAKSSTNEIQNLLKDNKFEEAILKLASETKNVILKYSPQNKSDETWLFESLVKKILDNEQVAFSKSRNNENIEVEFLYFDEGNKNRKMRINLNELMSKVNMTHVQFPKKYHELYSQKAKEYSDGGVKIVKSDKDYIAQIDADADVRKNNLLKEAKRIIDDEIKDGKISQAEYDEKIKKIEDQVIKQVKSESENLRNLSHAEKAAVHIYTTNEYKNINNFLRQQYTKIDKPLEEVILNAAFCAQALNNISDTHVKHAIRHERYFSSEVNRKRQEMAEEGGVSLEAGFLSAAKEEILSNKAEFGANEGYGAIILFSNLRGKYIAPISDSPHEKEYLLPASTQIKWEGHKYEGRTYIFTTSVSDVLKKEELKPNGINPLSTSKYPFISKKKELEPQEKESLLILKNIVEDAKYFKIGKVKLFDMSKFMGQDYKSLISNLEHALNVDKNYDSLHSNLKNLSESLKKARNIEKSFLSRLTGKTRLAETINDVSNNQAFVKKLIEKDYNKTKDFTKVKSYIDKLKEERVQNSNSQNKK
jgi:hypothetical protein